MTCAFVPYSYTLLVRVASSLSVHIVNIHHFISFTVASLMPSKTNSYDIYYILIIINVRTVNLSIDFRRLVLCER